MATNQLIGHTKSGQPVYETFDEALVKHYSYRDHVEAGATHFLIHREALQKAIASRDLAERLQFAKVAKHHELQSQAHLTKLEALDTTEGKSVKMWH